MPRMPKPWFRKDRRIWFVQIDGKQCSLGSERTAAFKRYHELMAVRVKGSPSRTLAKPLSP